MPLIVSSCSKSRFSLTFKKPKMAILSSRTWCDVQLASAPSLEGRGEVVNSDVLRAHARAFEKAGWVFERSLRGGRIMLWRIDRWGFSPQVASTGVSVNTPLIIAETQRTLAKLARRDSVATHRCKKGDHFQNNPGQLGTGANKEFGVNRTFSRLSTTSSEDDPPWAGGAVPL